MPEDQKGQEEQVTEEVNAQSEEQLEEVSTSEEPAEEPQEETQEDELPQDAKERTRIQFEKLKKHNQELAEENKRLKGNSQPIPSVLDYLTPGVPQEVQMPPQMPQFVPQMPYPQYAPQETPLDEELVDENGYVNRPVLEKRLEAIEQARKKAEEAERRAQEAESRISRFEQDAETKQLYQAYPELDPLSEVFDKDAYDLVKNELTSQIVSSGKRDAMKAAERMSKYFRKQAPANQKVLEQRRQAVATPGTTARPPSTDFEELKLRSRTDPNALFERLQRIGQ